MKINYLQIWFVPRAGVEPAQPLQPLVFETSASTDSAIWASVGAKVYIFGEKAKRRKIRSIGFRVAFTKLLEEFWPNTCRRWDFDSDKRRCGCILETGCHFQIAAKTDS